MSAVGSVSNALAQQGTDPLLAALIGKLPASGSSWSIEQRTAWLKMMWMAFDVVYGAGGEVIEMPDFLERPAVTAAPRPALVPDKPKVKPDGVYAAANLGKPRVADQRYLIDIDGVAFGPGGQVDAKDIPSGEMVWDFRAGEQDLSNVVWASGHVEQHALPALIVMKG
jgi:hypothetical protein